MFCSPQHGLGAFHVCPPKEGGSWEALRCGMMFGSVAGWFRIAKPRPWLQNSC